MHLTNRELIQHQIQEKLSCDGPYFPPDHLIFNVKTDVNQFPYRRFFRGRPDSTKPIIWEREAGYSPIRSEPHAPVFRPEGIIQGPSTCFQIPCSTVLPCQNATYVGPLASQNACVYSSP